MALSRRGVLRLAFFSTLIHAVLSSVAIDRPILIDCGSSTPVINAATNTSWGLDEYYAGGTTYDTTDADADGLSTSPELSTLRAFPRGTNPCYHIPVPHGRFLVRLGWAYNDYDGLKAPPVIGVLIGPTQVENVDLSARGSVIHSEYLVHANTTLQICFHGSQGVPFINSIEVNPLDSDAYDDKTRGMNVVMTLVGRVNKGGPAIAGYPTDLGYRFWLPDLSSMNVLHKRVSTTREINNCGPTASPEFLPCDLFQTAWEATKVGGKDTLLEVAVNSVSRSNSSMWLLHLHVAEIDENVKPGDRVFDVIVEPFSNLMRSRVYLQTEFDVAAQFGLFSASSIKTLFQVFSPYTQGGFVFGLTKANGSLYDPILSGFELYEVIDVSLANASTVESELTSGIYVNSTCTTLTIGGGGSGGRDLSRAETIVSTMIAAFIDVLSYNLIWCLCKRCFRWWRGSTTRGEGVGVPPDGGVDDGTCIEDSSTPIIIYSGDRQVT